MAGAHLSVLKPLEGSLHRDSHLGVQASRQPITNECDQSLDAQFGIAGADQRTAKPTAGVN
jgi:hypothetical protein